MPVEEMKAAWRRGGLQRHVHLSVSGCLGPCDLANVALVAGAEGLVWLGALRGSRPYELLLAWAVAVAGAERPLPLPDEVVRHAFERYARVPGRERDVASLSEEER